MVNFGEVNKKSKTSILSILLFKGLSLLEPDFFFFWFQIPLQLTFGTNASQLPLKNWLQFQFLLPIPHLSVIILILFVLSIGTLFGLLYTIETPPTFLGIHALRASNFDFSNSTLARSSTTLKPSSIILIFSNGLYNTFVRQKLWEEFGASEIELDFYVFDFYFSDDSDSEWVNVLGRLYRGACVLEIKVDDDITVLSAEFDVEGSTTTTTTTTVASVAPNLLELAGDAENNALLPWWNASGDVYNWVFLFSFFFFSIIQARTF